MGTWNWEALQALFTLLGMVITIGGLYLVARELRAKEPVLAAQGVAATMSATKDEFAIMELALKRQETEALEMRAKVARISAEQYQQQESHEKQIKTMRSDFDTKLAQRDEEREAERARYQGEIDELKTQLEGTKAALGKGLVDLQAAQTQIKELTEALNKANSQLATVQRELETERGINSDLRKRLSEVEAKQSANGEAKPDEPKAP